MVLELLNRKKNVLDVSKISALTMQLADVPSGKPSLLMGTAGSQLRMACSAELYQGQEK